MTDRARVYQSMGMLFRFHAFPVDTMGKFCLVEAVVPPGQGAPPNHHAGETEAFYILSGEVTFEIEGVARTAGEGSFVSVPDGAVHSFRVVGPNPARILVLNAPGHMHEQFFTQTGEPVAPETTLPGPMDGPPDVARILAVAAASGMTILPPA
ncbi:cupin domain-containing protein [Cereibacter sp. SYSU M97828]|nr:cupin domain-containing protein [Cereibacter flavus]